MVQYGAAYFPFPKRLQTLPRELKNLGCVVEVKICQELRFTAFGRQPTTRLYQSKWKGLDSSSCFERSCSCSCCRCCNRWVPNSYDCRLRSSLVCSSRYRLCESWVSCSRDNVLCSSLVCSSCARRHSEDCSEHARQSFCSQPYPLPTRSFVMYV